MDLVEDEHLFQITHQGTHRNTIRMIFYSNDFCLIAYELWFKQILYDMDGLLRNFRLTHLDETQTLYITSRLERIVKIMKVQAEKMHSRQFPSTSKTFF